MCGQAIIYSVVKLHTFEVQKDDGDMGLHAWQRNPVKKEKHTLYFEGKFRQRKKKNLKCKCAERHTR